MKKAWPIFGLLNLFFLYGLNQGLGILVSQRLISLLDPLVGKIKPLSLWRFLFEFLLASLLVLAIFFVLARFKQKNQKTLKAFFVVSVGAGALITLGVFLGDLALVIISVLCFWWWKKPWVWLQNLLIVLAMAGAGSFLGIRLEPSTVVVLLILFSIYDYLAVYKTRHMIKMAKAMIEGGAIIGLVIPLKKEDLGAEIEQVRSGERFFILGGGDIVFPLLLASSMVSQSLLAAAIVSLFALMGLFSDCFFFFSRPDIPRRPIPALPLIAWFSMFGFLITLLI